MPVKKHFINHALQEMLIDEYLAKNLPNAGYAGLDMQKTPMGSRITIKTARPGIVIGHKGNRVKELTDEIKAKFNINVPTIDVDTVKDPETNAQIMAERLAFDVEKGQNYRKAAYSVIRRVVGRQAKGIEITISGKVTSQRARRQTFRAGVICKCGIPAMEGVQHGVAHLVTKTGVMGIQVHIMPSEYLMPDVVKLRDEKSIEDAKEKRKKAALVEDFTEVIPEEEITEIIEEGEELFDDTTGAKETVLKAPEKVEEVIPAASEAPKAEEKPAETEEPKKAPKKKSSRKKSSKKAEDGAEEASEDQAK